MKRILPILLLIAIGCKSSPPSPRAAVSTTQPAAESAEARRQHLDQAIKRGVEFLVSSQQPDGSWGTGRVTRGFEVYSMVPGSHDAFRVGTSALCVMALREAADNPAAKAAHDRGLQYLIEHGQARRDDGTLLYNTWAHTYALQALAIEMRDNKDPKLAEAAKWHLDRLCRYETYMGGWNYYDFDVGAASPSLDPTSFGTAAGLVALWEAKQAGINAPEKLITRAINRTIDMRLPNGAYLYGFDGRYFPRASHNLPRGSVGRTQACNFALLLWNHPKIGPKQILDGFELFEKDHEFLQMGRQRPLPHDSWYATAPYYYYFGHYYAARLVERLNGEERAKYAAVVVDGVLKYQEPDGSWWDFPMWDYHKPYGTAFAVMTLLRCR
jgi:hypothetical protein